MTILFDAGALGVAPTGTARAARRVLAALRASGADVTPFLLHSPRRQPYGPLDVDPATRGVTPGELYTLARGASLLVTCGPVSTGYQLDFPFDAVPCVAMFHDLIPWLLRACWPAEYATLPRYDAIGCVSECTRRDLLLAIPAVEPARAVRTYHPHVPQRAVAAAVDLPRRFVLWMYGATCVRKRFDVMLDALALVPESVEVCVPADSRRFLRCYAPPERARIAAFCERWPGRARIFERASEPVMAALYQRCEAVVVTSDYEGFCLPILEAHEANKPLVLADNSCMREIAGEQAHYFTPRSPGDLARALLAALSGPPPDGARELARFTEDAFVDLCLSRRRGPAVTGGVPSVDAARPAGRSGHPIPKVIAQTYKTHALPREARDCRETWHTLNPDHTMVLFDDAEIDAFLQAHFDETAVRVFRRLPLSVMRSDMWRLAWLYVNGGVYADIDASCVVPVSLWPMRGARLVVGLESPKHWCNWCIAAEKGHPAIKHALDWIVERALGGVDTRRAEFVHHHTGPAIWTEALNSWLADELASTVALDSNTVAADALSLCEGPMRGRGVVLTGEPALNGGWVKHHFGSRHFGGGYQSWIAQRDRLQQRNAKP